MAVVDGHGSHLTLADGRRVLDATAQGSAAVLGHRHPELTEAMRRAAGSVFVGEAASSLEREAVAEDLLRVAFADEPWAAAVRFTATASEANDLALSLAQTVTGRSALVSRELCYHGAVGLARDVTAHPLWHGGLANVSGGWRPATRPRGLVRLLPAGDGRPPPAAVLETVIGDAAAVILDWGSGGVYPEPGFQDAVAGAARRAGAWWIQDEVVSIFRTGRMLACQAGKARPDVVTMGKGLTAGAAPGAALVLSEAAAAALQDRRWQSVATFYGHPLTLAAVRATLRIVDRDGLVARAREAGRRLAAGLGRLVGSHPCARLVGGAGLLWSLELAGAAAHGAQQWHGDGSTIPVADRVAEWALAAGVKVAPYGGCSLWVTPPLVVSDEEIDALVRGLDEALGRADALLA